MAWPSGDCKNCNHSFRDHNYGGVGTCKLCSCKAFKRMLHRILELI